jgi:hypothetical protein
VLTAVVGLIAAVAAALITRSVTISNHRQTWINGLRDDLASFFAAIDVMHFNVAKRSEAEEIGEPEEQRKARSDAALTYRKILMRLNMNEQTHQELERSLGSLLMVNADTASQDQIADAVTLARNILKREWEVTKYGSLTEPMLQVKEWRRKIFGKLCI